MDKKLKYKMVSDDEDDEDKEMMSPQVVETEVPELQKAQNVHYFAKEKTDMLGKQIAEKLAAEEGKAQEVPAQDEELKKMRLLKLKKFGAK